MIGIHFKKIPLIALFLSSFAASAHPMLNKDYLVQQCLLLSENITALVASQAKPSCMEKLGLASTRIISAVDFIVKDESLSAKEVLDNAIYALQYSVLNNCNRYIQISHAKFEVQRIKNSF